MLFYFLHRSRSCHASLFWSPLLGAIICLIRALQPICQDRGDIGKLLYFLAAHLRTLVGLCSSVRVYYRSAISGNVSFVFNYKLRGCYKCMWRQRFAGCFYLFVSILFYYCVGQGKVVPWTVDGIAVLIVCTTGVRIFWLA